MESRHVMCSTMTKKERRRPHTNTRFPDTREKKQEKGKKSMRQITEKSHTEGCGGLGVGWGLAAYAWD